jgi:hypothetical protein
MAARSWYEDAQETSQGLVYLEFSFLTNGASDPAVTSFRGGGVATVTHGATGRYVVTLSDGYRYVTSRAPDMEDLGTGSDDGAYATIGPIANEGSGATTALSFNLYTRSAAGNKTDFSARRCGFTLALKQSGNGT